jgi:hypothetical protein
MLLELVIYIEIQEYLLLKCIETLENLQQRLLVANKFMHCGFNVKFMCANQR